MALAHSAPGEGAGVLSRWNPDKHLRIHNPRLKLALRMIYYAMVVSSFGGFLFALPFLLEFSNLGWENIKQALILALFFGGGTALPLRLLASIFIGLAMAFVTGKFPAPASQPRAYLFTMGLTAAAVVHLFAPIQLVRFYLSELSAGEYEAYLETVSVIAVYAGLICLSQVMAGKYIRETRT